MSRFIHHLKDPVFIQEVIDQLLSDKSHSLIKKPRVRFDEVLERKKKRLLEEGYTFQKIDDHDYLRIIKPNEAPKSLEESFMDDEFLEPELPTATFHRRDTFLTGGSVAGVILEKLQGVPAVINDIDLFYYQFTAKSSSDLQHDLYENLIDEKYNYKIHRVRERGLLNLVKIDPNEQFHWEDVLKSFDLNYAQVGIILEEKKLIFSEAFLSFLEDRVISLNEDLEDEYPLTTYIRASQKAKDLQSRFFLGDAVRDNLIYMRDIIFEEDQRVFEVVHDRSTAEREGSELITKKRWDYWQKNPDLLLPWYSLESKTSIRLHEPKEAWFNFYSWYFKFYRSEKETYDCIETLVSFRGHFIGKNQAFFNRLRDILEAKLTPSPLNHWCVFFKANWKRLNLFKEDFSKTKLKSVSKFLDSHTELKKMTLPLLEDNYSLEDIIDFFLFLKTLPLGVLGTFEGLIDIVLQKDPYQRTNDNYYVLSLHARAEIVVPLLQAKRWQALEFHLREFLEEDLKKNKLVEGVKIGPFKNLVREITTVPQIKHEGQIMRHCVGGYAEKVRRGECRIFHLEFGGERSTIEIGIKQVPFARIFLGLEHSKRSNSRKYADPEKVIITERKKAPTTALAYCCYQHKGVCNARPSSKHKFVAQRLIEYLNGYRRPLLERPYEMTDDELMEMIYRG